MRKKIVFLTSTRADYGKMKPLMKVAHKNNKYLVYVFVTGMHTLSKYGGTWLEIEKDGFSRIYKYINQSNQTKMDITLSNTIIGFSAYLSETKPDMVVIHGDRLEALAGAIVGAFNNTLVAHIEGGETSGTIDESIRHAITKLSHLHFVANGECKNRLIRMGEKTETIFEIGSPDIDTMLSKKLPSFKDVKQKYGIESNKFSIFIFHPVTTELEGLKHDISEIISALISSNKKYVVIYPNNDEGSETILKELKKLRGNKNFRIYPSIRFEYFLTMLKNAEFIIGNSSSGIREAMIYGTKSINIGSRQNNRIKSKKSKNMIINIDPNKEAILTAINSINKNKKRKLSLFGDGNSASNFYKAISNKKIWDTPLQKAFIDSEDM
ncbi:MAG: hypothetical protein ACD_22C00041G0003 [uncultured bacterium]|nr:MAG: hypothetical protein ACD_22C00041G0003 [uncultured bacterium]